MADSTTRSVRRIVVPACISKFSYNFSGTEKFLTQVEILFCWASPGCRLPMHIIGTSNVLGSGRVGIGTQPLLASPRLLQHHSGTVRRVCKLQCRAASEARSQDGTLLPGPSHRVLASKKLGSLYLTLLPGHLQYLPAFLAPASVLISLEGSVHGAEWSRWLLGLLPVPQVR